MSIYNKKILKAIVIKTKMNKTIIVKVENLVKHHLYKKYVKKSIKLKVHDDTLKYKCGDIINIYETRPLSKTKFWKVVNLLKENVIIKNN